MGHLLISFLPVAAAPRCPVPNIPNAYRPITSKLVGFKLLCSYSSGYRPTQPTAQSSSPAPQQPDLYPPAISGRSRRNPGHGEDTTRDRPEHTTVTFGTSHPDVTHKTPPVSTCRTPAVVGDSSTPLLTYFNGLVGWLMALVPDTLKLVGGTMTSRVCPCAGGNSLARIGLPGSGRRGGWCFGMTWDHKVYGERQHP